MLFSYPQEFNRTDGDGTDSPATSSPYRDQRGKDRHSGPPNYYNARNASPAGSNRPHSLNNSRGPDPRSPGSEGRWPRSPPPSYADDWQVSGPYDQRDGSYYAERSYTPPIPQYTADYEHQSALTQSAPLLLHTSNPNYEHYNNIGYPDHPQQPEAVPRDSQSQPYGGGNPSYPGMQHEYSRGGMGQPYVGESEAVRGHAVLMTPGQHGHEHVHEQAYPPYASHVYNSAYDSEFSSQQHHQQPMHGEEYFQHDRVTYRLTSFLH